MTNEAHKGENSGGALEAFGLNDRVRSAFEPLGESGMILGRAARIDRGLPLIQTDVALVRAEPAAHLLRGASNASNRIAVGDWVALEPPSKHEMPLVEVILPRSSAFVRSDPGEHTGEQVVAANIDIVFVMQAATRDPNLRRLERELVLAWESGAVPVVLISKCDAFDGDVEALVETVSTVTPGVQVLAVSSVTGQGVPAVLERVGPGVTAALLGSSGVGKSTLINAIVGHEVQATAAVRETDGKGRHTTVARELVPLPGGGVIADTPGMRALALWEVDRGMDSAFSDIVGLAEECRFRDCTHGEEPGCAVRSAVECGELPHRRLESYLDLSAELAELTERKKRQAWRGDARRSR